MASANARLAIVAAVLVIFAVGGAVLIFGNQGPAPQQRLIQVTVTGDTMSPGQLQANEGDTITVSVSADRYEEIHLHGYDKHFFPSPGQPATLTFLADKTGNFVIEIEATSTPLGLLDVKPRGGFLGLGQPPDQSSTTIHAAAAGTQIKLATTASYNLVAEIGGLQAMYTPAQVSSQHPKTGEIMFGGTMTMPPGTTNISPDWHHLEVHIFEKKTGNVVKTANPVLTVKNDASGQTIQVPIVVMQGIVEGPNDIHYGNNVDLPKGEYTVTVVIGSETASFDFNI
ncbi:MAG: hypothetical protein ACHP7P_14670 [Terriglobales bacterium]